MLTMSIFAGIILFFIPSAFGGVLIMRVFARNFLYHKPFWAGITPTIMVTFFMLLVSTIIVYKLTKPFDTVLKRVKAGGEKPSDDEKKKCIASYNSIRLLIFIVHFVGFLGGQVGVALLEIALGKMTFNLSFIITLSLHAISVAAVFSLMTLYGFDSLVCAPARELLEIRTVEGLEQYKHPKVVVSLNTIFFCSLFFAIMNFVFIAVGIVGNPDFMATVDPTLYFVKCALIGFVVSFGVSAIPFLAYNKVLNKRIRATSNLVKSIAQRGDLTSRINITTIDDFGGLVGAINTLMNKLGEMVVSLKSGTGVVSNSATVLTDVSTSAVDALGQMKNAFDKIQNDFTEQNNLINNTNGDVDQLIEKVVAVQNHVTDQAAAVQQGSAAISEMIANIESVADLTKKADVVSEALAKTSEIGNEAISNAIGTVAQVQKSSEEMQNIINVIQQIASQTNLLSMNAAIEAAHAGEFGKGFAVVADEVRSLAASSGESAKNIQMHIKNMIEIINNGVKAMNSAEGAFKDIADQVEKNNQLTRTISSAMEEQRTGAEETLKTTNIVVDSMEAIKTLTDEETEMSKSVQNVMKNVVESSNQSMEVVANCVTASGQLNDALQKVEDSIQGNKDAVATMKENIDVFDI